MLGKYAGSAKYARRLGLKAKKGAALLQWKENFVRSNTPSGRTS
jgi:hypothetical protein